MKSLFGLFLFTGSVSASPVMLSPAELEAIGAISDIHESSQSLSEGAHDGKVRLDGIVYHQEDKWCVWLNGQRFSPNQHPENYKIVKVCHDSIEIVSTNEADDAQPIILTLGSVYKN